MPTLKLDRTFAWLGGGLFACSLILCAYAYQVRWGRTEGAGRQPIGAVLLDATVFTLFAVHHSLFAREPFKAWMSGAVPAGLVRSIYVWTASLLLILVVVAWQPIGGEVYRASGWTRWAHALVQLAGLGLIARSVQVIDALELAGLRTSDRPAALQTRGPYRLVRHPLYLGWMLIVLGTDHLTGDRALFAAMTIAYLVIAMPWEERSLERTFGDDYARYRRDVRWRVIPFVY